MQSERTDVKRWIWRAFSTKLPAALAGLVLPLLAGPATALATPTPAELGATQRDELSRLERRVGHRVRSQLRAVATAGSSRAARVSFVGGFSVPVAGATAQARARAFLDAHGALVGVGQVHRLARPRVRTWTGGDTVRYAVTLGGLPVLDRSVVVALQGDRVTSLAGGLPTLGRIADPRTALDPATVHAAVLDATGDRLHRVLELGYWIRGDEAVLVWRADQYRLGRRRILLIDATTGAVLLVAPGDREAQGNVYDPNPVVAGGYETVTLPELTSSTRLQGAYATVYQCQGPHGDGVDTPPCSQRSQVAAADANGDYLYQPQEPSLSDPFAEVQAYYHVTEFNGWLEDRFGFSWSCGGSQAIDVHVNWSYGNAFYGDGDGDSCPDITLGEGGLDFAYDADVIYHELTHGLVSQTAGLGCQSTGLCTDELGVSWIPGAINEGLADYFAMTYAGDPNLGEHIGQLMGDAHIRTAQNDARCPWDLISEVHHDGNILSGAAWDIRHALGATRADDLIYGALLSLPEDADYADTAAALQAAATNLQSAGTLSTGEMAVVKEILGPSGRNMFGCGRVIPLDDRPADRPDALAYAFPTFPGYIDEFPIGLQYTLDAPAGAVRLSLAVAAEYGLGASWRVYLRRDQPVQIQLSPGAAPVVTAHHTFAGSPASVTLTAQSDPPLVPGSVYYVAIVYAAPDSELFRLSGNVEIDPTVQADAGVPDSGTADGGPVTTTRFDYQPDSLVDRDVGEGCRTGSQGSLPVVWVLLVLLLVLRRRR